MTITAKNQPICRAGRRASVSFPGELYAELERIAFEKKVSVAWVVRDAVEHYLHSKYPLLQGDSNARR